MFTYWIQIADRGIQSEFKTDSVPTSTDVIAIETYVDNHYFIDGGTDADIILKTSQTNHK